jgi:hypothetical protein
MAIQYLNGTLHLNDTNGTAHFLHFQLLQRAPQKRCCNLKCHLSPKTTKTMVSLNKNVFLNTAERSKQESMN